jgi:hypothetical protein
MRAQLADGASHIRLAVAAAISILITSPECSAQIERSGGRHLVIFIDNDSDHAIAAGEIELLEVRDAREDPISTVSTDAIPRSDRTWTYFPDPLIEGQRYRVIFRAQSAHDPGKVVFRESRPFVFRSAENWRSLTIDGSDLRNKGSLIRVEFGKGAAPPDVIHAKPGDLIEIDYLFEGAQPRVEPKGGSHSQVIDVTPAGPRQIVVGTKAVGVASYFEAKNRGDDWVSVEIDGVARKFHVLVGAK